MAYFGVSLLRLSARFAVALWLLGHREIAGGDYDNDKVTINELGERVSPESKVEQWANTVSLESPEGYWFWLSWMWASHYRLRTIAGIQVALSVGSFSLLWLLLAIEAAVKRQRELDRLWAQNLTRGMSGGG